MNVAFFLNPKQNVAFLYNDFTLRQAIEKMKNCGYSAIPVITRNGKYVGTVSDGDFLWKTLEVGENCSEKSLMKELEKIPVTEILKTDKYQPASFSTDVEKLFNIVLNQNFVPVVDDTGNFSGIVTRKSVMQYLINI